MMSRMIQEGKHLWRLHHGDPLMDWRSLNQIWEVYMEPGNACFPYVLKRNRPNRRLHSHGDLGVLLKLVWLVVYRPRRGKNGS